MKKIIPVIISFLTWIVLLIIDTIIELQDTPLADSLQSVFSGVSFNRTTLMGIQFNQLDNSFSVGLHFFIILIIFILIGLFIGFREEITNYFKNLSK